ncbi:MAG: aldo/keto reductase [Trueperaceae bacterium]|nr:aldo/keto reductase [Trueperaceae bacterium]
MSNLSNPSNTDMHYTNLGRSGLKVSRICLGTMSYGTPDWRPWVLPEAESRPFLQRALELGINFFDTADMYSLGVSEEVVGRALKDFARRDEVVIATKVYMPMGDKPNQGGLSRKHIMDAVDASLKRLGTDYIDLYQIHRWDYSTPIEETLETLNDLVRSGRVRYLGGSSMHAYQFARSLYLAERHDWSRFVSMQNHYNLIYREEEREMLPLCREEGVGIIPWSPLARGYLTRPPNDSEATPRGETDDIARRFYQIDSDRDVVNAVVKVAEARAVPPAQIALAWLLRQPGVSAPIVGATKMKHLEDAVDALALELTDDEVAQLEAPYVPHPVLGHK